MIIANIYPIPNQKHYKDEQIGMILAHLVKQGKYDPKNFPEGQYLIMDNGLFENAQVSTNLEDLINLAEDSGLPIKEIVVPDCMFNFYQTCELFEKNLQVIRKWQWKYTFMFVAQHDTYEQFVEAIKYINKYKELNIVVGVPKFSKSRRTSLRMQKAYALCELPIHFLGMKESFAELSIVSQLIRSCDTSQVSVATKYYDPKKLNLYTYVRSKYELINLAEDALYEVNLEAFLAKAPKNL